LSAGFFVAAWPLTGSAQDSLRWSLVREIRFGNTSDVDPLSEISWVRVGADGRTYVFPARAHTESPPVDARYVHVYDANGALVTSFIRGGRGPGEVESVASVGLLGDTLWVWDHSLRRVSSFSLSGTFLSSWSYKLPDGPVGGRAIEQFADGSMVMFRPGFPYIKGNSTPLYPDLYYFTNRSSSRADTLYGVSRFASPIFAYEKSLYQVEDPFTDVPLILAARIGRPRILVVDRAVAKSNAPTAIRILAYEPGKKHTIVARVPYVPRQITRAAADSTLSAVAERQGRFWSGDWRSILKKVLSFPNYYPPVTNAFVGRDGSIWLAREGVGESVTWLVLDSSGKRRGSVSLPRERKILEADLDRLWVEEVNDDEGGVYVVRYRLVKR
jgi:hypothetical protein